MKSIVLLTALLLSSYAHAAPIGRAVMNCRALRNRPDNGMSLQVRETGRVGQAQILIARTLFVGVRREAYNVRLQDNHGRVGAPLVYEGPRARLSVNFTVAPPPNGWYQGFLQTRANTGAVRTERILCHQ